ncbi:hypothetical protein Pan258_17070 [Symmachiella dynata]|nr:hypothetical protein Pan258_17070 [Symmachiella dynata]
MLAVGQRWYGCLPIPGALPRLGWILAFGQYGESCYHWMQLTRHLPSPCHCGEIPRRDTPMTNRKRYSSVCYRLLFAALMICLGFFVLESWMQRSAIEKITAAGGQVTLQSSAPEFLRNLIDDRHLGRFNSIVEIRLNSPSIGDTELAQILAHLDLSDVDTIDLSGTTIGDDTLANLSDCSSLKWLNLTATRVTNTGLRQLAHIEPLESISACSTDVTYEGSEAYDRQANKQFVVEVFCFGNANVPGRLDSVSSMTRQLDAAVGGDDSIVTIAP